MLATLGLCAALGLAGETVRARLPGTSIEVSFVAETWKGDKKMKEFDDPSGFVRIRESLVSGSIGKERARLSLRPESNYPHKGSEEWRKSCEDARAKTTAGDPFDVDGIACVEYTEGEGERKSRQWDAHPVLAGFVFHLTVSRPEPPEGIEAEFKRDAFAAIVKSVATTQCRRGAWEDFPPEVHAFFAAAGRKSPDEMAWVEGECKARPDDWIAHFALGEYALAKKVAEKGPKAYAKAVDALKKKKDATPQERFVLALAEEGWGIELDRAGKGGEAMAHYKSAFDLAPEAKPIRGPAAYALATAHSAKGDATGALKYLKEAVACDPRFGDMAKNDRGLEKAKKSREFSTWLGNLPPAPKEPAEKR